jgi:uncharacterized small protein (DUF1192 family)
MKIDQKSLAAVAAIIVALSGGAEMRVQIGLLASKVDRIEARLDTIDRASRTAGN